MWGFCNFWEATYLFHLSAFLTFDLCYVGAISTFVWLNWSDFQIYRGMIFHPAKDLYFFHFSDKKINILCTEIPRYGKI